MAASDDAQAAREAVVDQIHQVLVEVKEFLKGTTTRKGQQLLGKVKLVLNNWDDDALFSSSVELEDVEFPDEDGDEDGGSFFPEDEDDED